MKDPGSHYDTRSCSVADSILLLPYEFPFGNSETFLESEIEYLAKQFETVWVLPARAIWAPTWFKSASRSKRTMPLGCVLMTAEKRHETQRIADVACAIPLIAHANLIRGASDSLAVQYYLATREAIKASMLARTIARIFPEAIPYSYSYWKTESASALASLRSKGLLPGFVTRCHGGDLYYEAQRHPYRPFDRFIAEQSDAVIAISQHGADYLVERGFEPKKVMLSRLGVRKVPKAVASSDGVLRIVSCSNVIPVKRVELIAKALAMLPIRFEWTHFGDGPESNHIKAIASTFPPTGRAVFPGRVSNAAVLKHYAHQPVDVFINVSRSEGVPVSIMEALNSGIPCLATDVGGSGEIVDESCGMLLAPEITERELASLLRIATTDLQSWAKKRAAAYQRGSDLCDAESNYTHFAKNLFERVIRCSTARQHLAT